MREKKLIIYDLDGTLVDSSLDIAKATNETLKYMGAKVLSVDAILKFVGKGVRELIIKALPVKDDAHVNKATIFFRDYYLEHCADEALFFKGMLEVVQFGIKHKIKQAVFTNKPKIFTDALLNKLNAAQYFDFILSAEEGFDLKPCPDGVCHILEQLKIKPEETLFVGDSQVDYLTTKNANVDFVFMTHGYASDEERALMKNNNVCCCDGFSLKKTIGSRLNDS